MVTKKLKATTKIHDKGKAPVTHKATLQRDTKHSLKNSTKRKKCLQTDNKQRQLTLDPSPLYNICRNKMSSMVNDHVL